jgi:predicted nucleotidyltransferase
MYLNILTYKDLLLVYLKRESKQGISKKTKFKFFFFADLDSIQRKYTNPTYMANDPRGDPRLDEKKTI